MKGNNQLLKKAWGYKALYSMAFIGFAWFILFRYVPLYGILIVFKQFRARLGIMGSPWVGLQNFRAVLTNIEVPRIVLNTLYISFLRLIFGFPAPIILSLLLNELQSRRFKRIVQSLLYLPHFLSWIVIAGLCYNLFSINNGVIPLALKNIGIDMPSLMTDPKYFIGFLVVTDIWKGMGWGTIIYLAAISGIDAELYESAIMDGCNRFQQAIHITLPCMAVTIVTLLVLSAGGIMNAGFDQIFNLLSARTQQIADIIDTYVYRIGIVGGRFEHAAAIGLMRSVVNAALLLTVNWVAGRIGEESPL
jgi:putative aldouronate transport system permease protein